MNCLNEEQLNAYLDGVLSASETESCQKHLSDCESCRQKVAAAKEIEKAGAPLKSLVGGIKLKDSVMAQISKENLQPEALPAQTTNASAAPFQSILRWCLAGAFLVAAGFFTGNLLQRHDPLTTIPARYRSFASVKATCLSFAASIDGRQIQTGDTVDFPTMRLSEINGNFDFAPASATNMPGLVWNGRATIGIAENTLFWHEGAGDIEVKPGSELKIHLVSHIIAVQSGKISLSGSRSKRLAITLRSGTATVRGRNNPVQMQIGQEMTLQNGIFDQTTPDLAPMTPQQVSESLQNIPPEIVASETEVVKTESALSPASIATASQATGLLASDSSDLPVAPPENASTPVITPFSVQPLIPHGSN